jgi:hypothetical protein
MEMAGCRRPNNRFVPWQRSSPIGNPLLFVIPSEADLSRLAVEGSAVPRASPGNVDFHAGPIKPPPPGHETRQRHASPQEEDSLFAKTIP